MRAFTPAADAALHAELLYRAGGGDGGAGDQLLASIDATAPPAAGLHLVDWIDTTLCAQPIPAQPGDGLVLRIKATAGSSNFQTLETELVIP